MKPRHYITALSLIMAITGLSPVMAADPERTADDERGQPFIGDDCLSSLCPTNGPHLTGIALQGVALDGIALHGTVVTFTQQTGLSPGMAVDTEDDERERRIGRECQSAACPTNGPHLTGIALQGVALDGLALQGTDVTLHQQAER